MPINRFFFKCRLMMAVSIGCTYFFHIHAIKAFYYGHRVQSHIFKLGFNNIEYDKHNTGSNEIIYLQLL